MKLRAVIPLMMPIFLLVCVHCKAFEFQVPERVQYLTHGLPLYGAGLEIAPFYRPTLMKSDYNIYYTDYTTSAELNRKHAQLPEAQIISENIVDIDFIWSPGSVLSNCVKKRKFDYAIASHVIEHVPNVVGWVSQILDVLNVGGVLSLAVPDKRYTFDAYRQNTSLSEFIDHWVRGDSIPSPGQIFDMLSLSIDDPSNVMPAEEGIPFETLHRNYSDHEALEFALHSFKTGHYLDIHCSVFTPQSFEKLFLQLKEMGILNIEVSKPICLGHEFFIRLIKLGDPTIRH